MPPPDKKRKRLLEEDLLESKRSRDGGRGARSPIARSDNHELVSRKWQRASGVNVNEQDGQLNIPTLIVTSDRAHHNQSTLMITITGASVQEAIDLVGEVLREEDRRGPAVRWVLDCCNLSLFCSLLSLQGE